MLDAVTYGTALEFGGTVRFNQLLGAVQANVAFASRVPILLSMSALPQSADGRSK
jgi:hypothetical protein